MSLPRFLVDAFPSGGLPIGSLLELPEAEAHHAARVLRCVAGNEIVLFDGRGNEASATIHSINKRSVSASIASTQFAPRDHDGRLHFAVALPKGERQRSTIEKLVELGVDSLTPLTSARSVALVNETNRERLDRYVIESCKQCGRNRAMEIQATTGIEDIASRHSNTSTWVLHPSREGRESISIHDANRLAIESPVRKVLFLVGPEGGFTEEEIESAQASGAKVLSLGERILRVETAVATAAVLGHCWLSS